MNKFSNLTKATPTPLLKLEAKQLVGDAQFPYSPLGGDAVLGLGDPGAKPPNGPQRPVVNTTNELGILGTNSHCNIVDITDHDDCRLALQAGFSTWVPKLPTAITDGGVIDIGEDVMILAYDLVRSRNLTDYGVATISFLKRRLKRSVVQTIIDAKLMPFLLDFIGTSEPLALQGDFIENLQSCRDVLDVWPRVKASPLWRKISKVIIFATSLTLFADCTTGKRVVKVEETFYQSQTAFTFDFTHCILDLLLFLVERGHQIMVTGRVDAIFHTGTEYETWYTDSSEIVAKSRFLSNPETHGIDIHTFTAKLNLLIEKGKAMSRYACELDKSAKLAVRAMLGQLQMVQASFLNKRSAQMTRKAPLSLLVEGHTSIGKTTFSSLLHYYYGTLQGKDVSMGCRHTRNSAAKFWDGFSSDQWSVLLDDIGFLKPGNGEVDPTLLETIQIVNNAPYSPDMAALEAKGAAPLRCELLVATTNTPTLNLEAYFACPAAVARRFPYHIRIRPKNDYIKNSVMLDSSKLAPMLSGEYPDWWDIEILVPEIIASSNDPAQEWKTSVTLKTLEIGGKKILNMSEFLPWLADVIYEHTTIQSKIRDSEVLFQSTKICRICKLPELMCKCEASELIVPTFTMQGAVEHYAVHGFIVCVFAVFSWAFMLRLSEMVANAIIRRCTSRVSLYVLDASTVFLRWFTFEPLVGYAIMRGRLDHMRHVMRRCGDRVARSFNRPAICALIVTALSTVLVAYKFMNMKNVDMEPQGGLSSKLGTPPDDKKERENVWFKPTYEVCSFDASRLTKSWKALSIPELEKLLFRNTVMLRAWTGSSYKISRAFGIGGQYLITTNHSFPEFSTSLTCRVVRSHEADGVNTNVEVTFYPNDVTRDVANDIVLLRIRAIPPLRDLRALFISEKALTYRGKGAYVGRNADGSFYRKSIVGIQCQSYHNDVLDLTLDTWMGTVENPTVAGDCGTIAYAETGMGPVLIGLHQLGNGHRVGVRCITREMINAMTEDVFVISSGEPLLDTPTTNVAQLGPVHNKSPLRYIEDGVGNVYGSFTGFRVAPKSSVKPTIICKSMIDRGFSLNHGQPVMKGWRPWRRALVELTNHPKPVDTGIVDKCVQGMVSDWLKVGERWKDELRIYDVDTVVNGKPGVRYVDKINRKTSAGFPWRKSKKYLISPIAAYGDLTDPVEFSDEVMERVDKILARYMVCERSHPIFTASLKDEALKFKKIDMAKTRVFMGGPTDFTIVMRMVFLSFVRVVQSNKFIFESAPGTEVQTSEWDRFYRYITKFGIARTFFGDYQDYDISMNAIWILAAFEAIAIFHEKCGCHEEHVNLIRCIGYDIAFALIDFHGDLVEFFGKNPSGQALTVIINGIINSLYMRYAYVVNNPDGECTSFKEFVVLMTYGDDNMNGVSDEIDWFNHTTVQRALGEIGVVYTMADKDAESVPFINVDEGSFLKRTWRFEKETGTMMAPLEEESIVKSLMIGVASKFLTPEVHITEIMHSANDEWFWHGKPVFEERQRMLRALIDEHRLLPYMNRDLASWDELIERYRKNSAAYEAENCDPAYPTKLSLQGRDEPVCDKCHFPNCALALYQPRSDVRLCCKCWHCKFDEVDLDCFHCSMNDTCEFCFSRSRYIRQHNNVRIGDYRPWLCNCCALRHIERMQLQGGQSPPTTEEIPTRTAVVRAYRASENVLPLGYSKAKLLLVLLVTAIVNSSTNNFGAWSRSDPIEALVSHHYLVEAFGSALVGETTLRIKSSFGSKYRLTNFKNINMTLQSGEEGIEETAENVMRLNLSQPAGVTIQSQTASFVDASEGEMLTFAPPRGDTFKQDAHEEVDLKDFLSRPTLIKTFTWTTAGFGETTFDPWTLFLQTSQIKSKIDNFAFLHANLHLKVVVNAAPFYYGALLMAYTPLPTWVTTIDSTPTKYIPWSQRPHIWIYPQTSSGGEMVLPFVYPENFVDLTVAADVATLGQIKLLQYTNLASANGATSNGCTLQIYAWLEDATLTGPTIKLSLQGGDEYGNGPISAPATAVAHWSEYMSRVPIIGRFAKATQIGASAVAGIATLFGWTNVPVIDNVAPMKNLAFHSLASAHIGEPVSKFTLDPKGELSVDPALIGLGAEDELSMVSLVQRESYLTTATWNTADAAGALLFTSVVTPSLFDRGTAGTGTTYSIGMTPMAWIGQMFQHWRGDIIFRFKIICTKYHSGRLRVTWDPVGSLGATTDYTHVAFTKVVDIGQEDSVEFRVPYMQALAWLQTDTSVATANNWSTSAYTAPSFKNNGSLTLRVLTNLSAPVDTAPVAVLVFVRGAETLEFANPRDIPNGLTQFALQGGEEPCKPKMPSHERYLTNWGEAIPSLRILLRRSVKVDSIPVGLTTVVATDKTGIVTNYQTRLPPSPGYDPFGASFAKGVVTPATTYPFDYSSFTHLAWVSAAYVALRGSVRWHYNFENAGGFVPNSTSVTRVTTTIPGTAPVYATRVASATTSRSIANSGYWASDPYGMSGTVLTNAVTQTGVSVEMPMMTNYKFQNANPTVWHAGDSKDFSYVDTYNMSVVVHPAASNILPGAVIQRYVAAGTDFNLHFFLNAPNVKYCATIGVVPV